MEWYLERMSEEWRVEIARLEGRMDTLQESLKTMQERYLREMSHLSQEMSARDAARARRETYILLAILVVAAFGSAVGSWFR